VDKNFFQKFLRALTAFAHLLWALFEKKTIRLLLS